MTCVVILVALLPEVVWLRLIPRRTIRFPKRTIRSMAAVDCRKLRTASSL
jgi:hypothetical protein